MSRITEYIMEDELGELLSRFERSSSIRMVITDSEGGLLAGDAALMEQKPLALADIELEGKTEGQVMAFDGEQDVDHRAATVELLKGTLEGILSREMDLENLSLEIANNYEEINEVLENNTLFLDALEPAEIIDIALGRALTLTESTVSSIMLLDEDKKVLKLAGRKGGEETAAPSLDVTLEGSVWEGVVNDLQPFSVEDVSNPEEFDQSVFREMDFYSFATKTFLAVPLQVKEEAIGVLNVGDREEGFYLSSDIKFLSALALQAAGSIEKAKLYKNIEEESKLRANFQRYLSPTIVEDIVNRKADITLGGEAVECSVLFSDIEGFTTMAEKEKPEVVINLLNEYFSVMTEIIFRNRGTLDKFIGDAIMAIFGAPVFSPRAHIDAVLTAIQMNQGLDRLRKKWAAEGKPLFRHRIGINTGLAVAGNIGSTQRMEYTVIGDVVNLASRLESNARPMVPIISNHTYAKIRDQVRVKKLESMRVKGKREEIIPYEVLAVKPLEEEVDSKRRFTRIEVAITIAILDSGGEAMDVVGTLHNISIGGALLAIPHELKAKSMVTLAFKLDPPGCDVSLSGQVVFLKKMLDPAGNTFFFTGIEFDDNSRNVHYEELKSFIEG